MLQLERARRSVSVARFTVEVATRQEDIEEAQRLRWQVFVEEQGATPEPGIVGLEADRFDPWCRHLIVRDQPSGMAVGTYRLLMPREARRLGGFYTEQEFDIGELARHRDTIVEIGRSCVHRDFRGGTVIALLWSGLADLILGTTVRYIIGCASISLSDGGKEAASIYRRLVADGHESQTFAMRPRNPLVIEGLGLDAAVKPPPLIKGYLRAGAEVAGPPAIDPDFGTADLPMVLPLDRLSPRYARHFGG